MRSTRWESCLLSILLILTSQCSIVAPSSAPDNDITTEQAVLVTNVPNVYETPRLKRSMKERFKQNFHIWLVRHPRNIFTKLFLPPLSLFEGLKANDPTYLVKKRDKWGPNFCVAGEVVLGEFANVEKSLTSPQARTFRLGTTVLDAKTLPMGKGKGRNVFLLALSDEGAGGSGEHEAFRKALVDHVISHAAMKRQEDDTSKKLLEKVAKDYAEMDHGEGGSFFTDNERGLNAFFIRYMHHALFDIDPNDEAKMKVLTELYYGSKVTVYWFKTLGNILRRLNVSGARNWPNMIKEVIEIYEQSPALANFQENNPQYKDMTKHELAAASIPILGIAALIGPQSLAVSSMGSQALPAYDGHENVAKIDVTKIWDKIDLNDRDALEKYLFECGRLWNPVSATHRVAQEEFTAKIGNKEHTFPKGTIVNIPIILSMLDDGFWGPTTFEFDHKRENLCPYSMIFHSVGDRSGGRICPGRSIALKMLTDVLQVTGKVRRGEK